jgi:hypothetical protein
MPPNGLKPSHDGRIRAATAYRRREHDRSAQRAEAWARVEGRDLAHERQVEHGQRRTVPNRGRGDFEIG